MNDLNEIKELRKKLGITQKRLASYLGVDTKTVQNWEYGKAIPKSKHAILGQLVSGELNINEVSTTEQKNELKAILFRLKHQRGLTMKQVADELGINYSYLSDVNSGRSPFTEATRAKFIQTYGKHIIEPDSTEATLLKVYGGDESAPGNLTPFYDDVETVGGRMVVSSMDGVTAPSGYINTGDWFRDATAAIRHHGESMVEYPSGCILAVKQVNDISLVIPGEDYVIETSEYRVTKRLQRGKDIEHFTAYSTNTETYADGRLIHEPFDIPKESIVRLFSVIGYVVKKSGTIIFNTK